MRVQVSCSKGPEVSFPLSCSPAISYRRTCWQRSGANEHTASQSQPQVSNVADVSPPRASTAPVTSSAANPAADLSQHVSELSQVGRARATHGAHARLREASPQLQAMRLHWRRDVAHVARCDAHVDAQVAAHAQHRAQLRHESQARHADSSRRQRELRREAVESRVPSPELRQTLLARLAPAQPTLPDMAGSALSKQRPQLRLSTAASYRPPVPARSPAKRQAAPSAADSSAAQSRLKRQAAAKYAASMHRGKAPTIRFVAGIPSPYAQAHAELVRFPLCWAMHTLRCRHQHH